MSKIETRTFTLRAVRSEDGGAASDPQFLLRGTAARYGVLSNPLNGFREVIQRGAFKKAIAEKQDCRCTYNHDISKVLGRVQNGTLQLRESPAGLEMACQLDSRQQWHRDVWASVQRGDTNEMSFAFSLEPGDDDWDTDTDEEGRSFNRRTIRNVSHLMDVAVVCAPAYPETSVTARSQQACINRFGLRPGESFEAAIFRRTGRQVPLPTSLPLQIARLGERIRADFIIARANEILLKEARARAKRDVAVDEPGFSGAPCRAWGKDLTPASRHERAAIAHNVMASKARDLACAERHYEAEHQHRMAAQSLTEESASLANRACSATWTPAQKAAMKKAVKES